ncbi:MAG: proton-conducting transporter transmembrane domain-containing protein [Tepidisphaeraceae bacterium]
MNAAPRQTAARFAPPSPAALRRPAPGRSAPNAAAGAGLKLQSTRLVPVLTGLLTVAALGGLFIAAVHPAPLSKGGLTLDRLSAPLALLVAFVGCATARFAVRSLDGDPHRARFLTWLGATISAAFILVLSTHLLLVGIAWCIVGLCLHQLLTHGPATPEARRAANKKFLISRLGDAAFFAAVGVAWHRWHTLDIPHLLAVIPAGDATLFTLLIVVAAITKSAQFPFHTWLPEPMETPTPVSALMHAGVINAGGALLLRLSPLIAHQPPALATLVMVGTLTIAIGILSAGPQVKVKRALAWSTISQMGFLIIQLGLAAFPAALLHLLAHGLYKAHQFLRSGDVIATRAAPQPSLARSLGATTAFALLAAAGITAASAVLGLAPWHHAGDAALGIILSLSIGQYAAGLLLSARPRPAIAAALFAPILALALYRIAGLWLAPVLGHDAESADVSISLAILPVLTVIALWLYQATLPLWRSTPAGRAWQTHATYGFYCGVLADRIVSAIRHRLPQGTAHAH